MSRLERCPRTRMADLCRYWAQQNPRRRPTPRRPTGWSCASSPAAGSPRPASGAPSPRTSLQARQAWATLRSPSSSPTKWYAGLLRRKKSLPVASRTTYQGRPRALPLDLNGTAQAGAQTRHAMPRFMECRAPHRHRAPLASKASSEPSRPDGASKPRPRCGGRPRSERRRAFRDEPNQAAPANRRGP